MRTQQRSTTIAAARLVAFISIVGLGLMLSNWTALGTSGLSVTPTTVRFPPTAPGSFSYQSVTITNNGTSPETFSGYTTPSAKFDATSGHCNGPSYSLSIPAGGSCDYEFGYAPSNPGAQSGAGTISFESGATLNLMFAVGPVDGVSRIWGNVDCSLPADGPVVDIGDAIDVERSIVHLPVTKPADCPAIGDQVTIAGNAVAWGNVDCSIPPDPVDIGDAIDVERSIVGLPVTKPADCPAIGDSVVVS